MRTSRSILVFFTLLPTMALAQMTPYVKTANSPLVEELLGIVAPSDPTTLSERERFRQYVFNTAGPIPVLGEALGAGIGQWRNAPQEWGQGWGAYGKRFGSNMAYNGIRQSIGYGLATAFHEDDRYFASGRSGIWPRTQYALISTFTARREDGSRTFSISSVGGVVGASAVSSLWGPESWKGPGNIAGNVGVSLAITAGWNVVREFSRTVLERPKH